MNRPDPSVFHLSPAETLHLVEDLQDELAAHPDDVPVHDRRPRDLDRRKANLSQ